MNITQRPEESLASKYNLNTIRKDRIEMLLLNTDKMKKTISGKKSVSTILFQKSGNLRNLKTTSSVFPNLSIKK